LDYPTIFWGYLEKLPVLYANSQEVSSMAFGTLSFALDPDFYTNVNAEDE